MGPEVHTHVHAYPPAAMSASDAAAYLCVSESQFRKLCTEYPDRLRPFNYLPQGEKRWSRQDLDEFIDHRKAVGVEKVG